MYQNNAQRKREILMRSAASRLRAANAVDAVGADVRGCIAALPVSARVLRYSAAAVAGVAAVGALRLFTRRPAPAAPVKRPHFGYRVAAQLMTLVLLPWLRQQLMKGEVGAKLQRLHPVHLFFRWLGLEK